MAIYLDYASTTPMDSLVVEAMQPYFVDKFYNPSAQYLLAKDVRQDIEQARQDIAKIIGAKSSEVIFTAGATEANNLAINGVMGQFPDKQLLVSSIEHDSVLLPAKKYRRKILAVQPSGIIDPQVVRSSITDDTVLISIMQANNEIGTVQPIKAIAEVVNIEKEERNKKGNDLPLYLHTDSAQAVNYLDTHVNRLGANLMSINGGKIYGPKQSGFLYVNTGTKINGQILGGGQERGLRSGTENVPSIIGLAKALCIVADKREQEIRRLFELRQDFIKQLHQSIPNIQINGSLKHRLPNNVHITIPGVDNERIMMELDERGIMCAVGSACSASNDEPSHVLTAIGLDDKQARSSLRFTMGRLTNQEDIKKTVFALKDSCQSPR